MTGACGSRPNVRWAGRRARGAEGVAFVLENLNTEVDHPGTPFAPRGRHAGAGRAVDSPHLKMNLDLYHAQIGEGNLVELVRRPRPSR